MSYKVHMTGYEDFRTLAQMDRPYAWKHDLYFPPALVEINPTNLCNQQCRYCYTKKRTEDHETLHNDVLVDSFSQVANVGGKAVLLQGTGEPLMHKDLGVDYIFIQGATYTEFSSAGKEAQASRGFSEVDINEIKSKVMSLSDDVCRIKVKFPANDTFVLMDTTNWKKDFCQGIKFYSIISCDGGLYQC